MWEDEECHRLLEVFEKVGIHRRPGRKFLCCEVQGGSDISSVALADELNELKPEQRKVELRVLVQNLSSS